ncbi:MAG: TonB-dependent receptor [Bryobacterales bacterium]|nr:TonB-dependent receptor [Bryobacteraceae bacterium]MDW8129006.1 TonB-dependent receptor [Bryobacterales bacterium]
MPGNWLRWMSWWLAVAASAQQAPSLREQVVVTGSWEPIPLEEADRSVRSLPVRASLLTHGGWADLLRQDPSLDLRARAPAGVQTDLSVRGGTFGQTLVLLDGMRLNDPQTGHHSLNLPVTGEALSRVEVLHGSGSTLYGADAVGGVVNFVTAKPERWEARVRAGAGSHGTREQGVLLEGILGPWSQHLSAARESSRGFMPNREYRNLAVTSITRRETKSGGVSLVLGHGDRPFGAEGFYAPYPSWERTRVWFGAVQQRWRDTRLAAAYRRHTDLFVLDRARPEFYVNRHRSQSWQAALRRSEATGLNARLHYGVEAFRDSIVSTNLGVHARSRAAAYAAWDVRALRRFSLSLGARQESYRPGRAPFSPTASGGVWLNSRWKLRAAAARAFRLPSFTDLYYRDPVTRGSPELRPESAWNCEVGADWRGERVAFSGTLFERRERDGIDWVRLPGEQLWRAMNLQRIRMRGVEASLLYVPVQRHRIELGWTGLSGTRRGLGEFQSRYVFNYPVQVAVATWDGAVGEKLVARMRVHAVGRLHRKAYATVDVALVWQGGRFCPFLRAYNLNGARYEEIPGVPMPGRTLAAGIELRWQRRNP